MFGGQKFVKSSPSAHVLARDDSNSQFSVTLTTNGDDLKFNDISIIDLVTGLKASITANLNVILITLLNCLRSYTKTF